MGCLNLKILLMGVAGTGKTTVGRILAQNISAHFIDADDFHCSSSIEKMRMGYPLNDEDRKQWIERLFEEIEGRRCQDRPLVIACSALRRSIQELFKKNKFLIFYLHANEKTLIRRLKKRQGHFFGSELLDSQFEALELPAHVEYINVETQVSAVVRQCERKIFRMQRKEDLS